jgi:hypothetical protein
MVGQSLRVTECLSKAAEARQLHNTETDPDKKLTYLHVEQCWYRLAASYVLLDRFEASTKFKPLQ